MNAYVHRTLTARWARECGLDDEDAAAVGRAARDFDRIPAFKPWGHFACCGAERFARALLSLAVWRRSLRMLGWAIHAAQDACGHGRVPPWRHDRVPGIDSWAAKPPDVRAAIEERTKRMVREFVARGHAG